jgi:hypothetical protein
MWPLVLTASVGCYLLKLAGHAVPQSVLGRPRVRRIAALLPVALPCADQPKIGPPQQWSLRPRVAANRGRVSPNARRPVLPLVFLRVVTAVEPAGDAGEGVCTVGPAHAGRTAAPARTTGALGGHHARRCRWSTHRDREPYFAKQLRYGFFSGEMVVYAFELFANWRPLPCAQANSVGEPRSWPQSIPFRFLLIFGRSSLLVGRSRRRMRCRPTVLVMWGVWVRWRWRWVWGRRWRRCRWRPLIRRARRGRVRQRIRLVRVRLVRVRLVRVRVGRVRPRRPPSVRCRVRDESLAQRVTR